MTARYYQAAYIWFTRELEAGATAGAYGAEPPLKDPSQAANLHHNHMISHDLPPSHMAL